MESLEKYLSVKFQRPIKRVENIPSHVLLFHYDSKRVVKLETNQNMHEQIALYNYLKTNSHKLPIAKIYDVGTIQLPKEVVEHIAPHWLENRNYVYHIMEKVTITQELLTELDNIDRAVTEINEYYDDYIISPKSAVLYDLSNYIQEGDTASVYDIQNYFYKEKKESYELLERVIHIILSLSKENIWWNDVHSDQFGYNHKGELVAFDLDGLDIQDEMLYITKTNIKEGHIKTFEGFSVDKQKKTIKKFFKGLKHEIEETSELRKIFGRYLKGMEITDEEKKFVKQQSTDIIRMLGLGMIVPIPASSIIIPTLIIGAKKLGIELIPKGFRLEEEIEESMSMDEIINLIQDGKNIRVKYIYNYSEHDPNKSYRPVNIDEEGKITLDIDNEIYYTKIDWVEGIEENFINYDVDPSMTDPMDNIQRKENGLYWKKDKEYLQLLKDQGGIKGVIKKMKKLYDLDYSDCKDEEELHHALNMDNMI